MARRRRIRIGTGGLVAVAALGGVLLGCRPNDGAGAAKPTATPVAAADGGGGASLSSVAPNTFLTFEGKVYRLIALEQADLVDSSAFKEIGTASQADIDQADLRVFRRAGDDGAVYTFAPGQAYRGDASAVEGERAATPALWYRWAPEP